LKASHRGFDISKANCSSCHDPHGGAKGTRGALGAFRHEPYSAGTCTACHSAEGSSELGKRVSVLCWDCHDEAKTGFRGEVRHSPVDSGRECQNCHSPHAGATKSLLQRSSPALCFGCHERKMVTKRFKHPPAMEGCDTCHLPHTGTQPKLLLMGQMELCMQCHDKVEKTHLHGMGKSPYVDAVTGAYLNCTSCHDPHSSNYEKLTHGDRRRELCTRCHKKGQHDL
jgi:predicted CXXCH cytochrome family protein